jgi:hypothetical protein
MDEMKNIQKKHRLNSSSISSQFIEMGAKSLDLMQM